MDLNTITTTPTSSIKGLQGILQLQQQNLPKNISQLEKEEQGFVTVEHTIEQLNKFVQYTPQFVAIHRQEVVGYVLAMTKYSKKDIPFLASMFDKFEEIQYLENAPYQTIRE